MPLEIEIKYLDADHDALRQRLQALGAKPLGRWFESNVVYDDADRSLKAQGILLRLRQKGQRFVLTLKRASGQTSATAKIYEESETEILDAPGLRGILEGLGYRPALRYDKIREKWQHLGCEVCLDTLPFGPFAEIEGSEDGIAACALALNLPERLASTATYHELNRQHRAQCKLPPDESFVFAAAEREKILAQLARD